MKVLIAILVLLLFFAMVLAVGFVAGIAAVGSIKETMEEKKNER